MANSLDLRFCAALAAAGAAALAAGAPALAAASVKAKYKPPTVLESRHLWATVDVCNTPGMPRVIGVRGSMPGTGLHDEQMFMRFQVQYKSGADWKFISSAGDTGFRPVGSAVYKARQSGQYFTVPAVANSPYELRGVVSFQWRRRGHAVLMAMRETTPGHVSSAGADPAGYSAAACLLP